MASIIFVVHLKVTRGVVTSTCFLSTVELVEVGGVEFVHGCGSDGFTWASSRAHIAVNNHLGTKAEVTILA